MFKLILVCLAALLVAHETDALVVINRFGTFGGLGGIGRIVPVAVPLGGIRPFRPVIVGKRDINANITQCVLSSESSKMICAGVNQFSCDLATNFTGLGNFSFIVKDLALQKVDLEVVDKVEMDKKESTIENTNIEKVESVKMIEKHIEPVFQFLAEEEIVNHKVVAAKHTFVNPRDNKPVILSLYNNEDMTDCLGFRIKDHTCWEQFEKMVDTVKPDELEFELVISQLETPEGKKIDINKFAADNMLLEKTTATIGTEETSTLIDEETTTVVDEKTTIVEENATIVAIVKDTTTVA